MKDEIDCNEFISIGIVQPEQATKAGFQYCFEVGRNTGRTYLFCTEREELLDKWTRGLQQAISPMTVQNALQTQKFQRFGKLNMRSQFRKRKETNWTVTWCLLNGKQFSYYHSETRAMETLDLRKLVQLALDQTQDGFISSSDSNKDQQIPVFMLVFREKSFYFRSDTRADSESWLAALRKCDSNCGPGLDNQQLTSEGVAVILEKCTTYVEQYGLESRGIYRLNGTHRLTTHLLNDFNLNARNTDLTNLNVHDVTSSLKRWFKSLPGSLFTLELHQKWIQASEISSDQHKSAKLEAYKDLIEKLPEINRNTLRVLLSHLNNVAHHESANDMSRHNLAIVFGPTLMEPQTVDEQNNYGHTSQEIACVEDLLIYFDYLFDVTETDREKERMMMEAKSKMNLATQQHNMLTTLDYDMMVPIYINSKEEKCINYRINTTAGELIQQISATHDQPSVTWGLFEVTQEGERLITPQEHVLSVVKMWKMPTSNYLLFKHDYLQEKMQQVKTSLQTTGTVYEGPLKHYDVIKKKWTKTTASLKLNDDKIILSFTKIDEIIQREHRRTLKRKTRNTPHDDTKTIPSICLNNSNVYIGCDKKTEARNYCFSLITLNEEGDSKQFCVDSEAQLLRWICHIILLKNPSHESSSFSYSHGNSPSPSLNSSRKSSGSKSPFGTLDRKEFMSEVTNNAVFKRSQSFDEIDHHDDVTSSTGDVTQSMTSLNTDQMSDFAAFSRQQRPTSLMRGSGRSRGSFNQSRGGSIMGTRNSPVGNPMMSLKLNEELSNVLKNRKT